MVSKVCRRSACGCNNASHALRLQAKAPITMYAQFDSSVFTGKRKARTPFFNCSIKFSWLQRSLAKCTTSAANQSRSLVIEKRGEKVEDQVRYFFYITKIGRAH